METPKILEGKTAIIFGVANKRSIAWAVASKFAEAGARIIITYQDRRLEENVFPLVESLPGAKAIRCDLTVAADIAETFGWIKEEYGGLDALVHSVAFALKDELDGKFYNTSEEGFLLAHRVSSFTLTAVSKAAIPLMQARGGGSILAMSYLGSERVIPNYNVMGVAKASMEASVRYLAADLGEYNIRVNALSPGPINTLAARGISGFNIMIQHVREKAPLRRNTEQDEVADAALFLSSYMGRGITGELIYVDGGYNILGF